jgi:penicillin-binding protein 2B
MAGNRKKRRKRRTPDTVGHLMLAAFLAMALLVTDVFFVAIKKEHLISGTDLSAYADTSSTVTETISAYRGNIYDRNGEVIAEDSHTYDIYCVLDEEKAKKNDQSYVSDKEYTASVLSEILGMDKDTILAYLSQDTYQTELGDAGRNLTQDTKEKIEAENLDGIGFTDSITRVYPKGAFASHLIGYVTRDDSGDYQGQMGIEQVLNSYLAGEDGSRTYQADEEGYVLPGMKETVVSATNGDNVTLTIDSAIEEQLETSFLQTMSDYPSTTRIWGGVMEVDTGKVLAWGQYPEFDPNEIDITDYIDYGRQSAYEPGSTMKTFTWAATINEGKYNSDDTAEGYQYCYAADVNNNPVRTSESEADGCIYNYGNYSYDNPTLDEGLMKSLNTVAVTLENEYITPEILKNYLEEFGFFQSVDTDGLSDSSGQLNFDTAGDRINLAFGQGSTVTMLQLMQAYSAILSDGTCKKPYFIESIRDAYDSSKVYYQGQTEILSNPITEESAQKIRDVLWKVANVEGGGLYSMRIPECEICGKTGTSEVAVNGSYNSGIVISSIAIGMPADDPKVFVYYAFEHNESDAYKPAAEIALLRKVAQVLDLHDGESSDTESTAEPTATASTDVQEIQTYSMPDLVNHSVSYAQNTISSYGTDIIVLGGGSTVIDQYPSAGQAVETGQRVFLLTDTQSFTMPDMTGWTRKDVTALWEVTGFGFSLDGTGTVVSQSVPAGTVVTKGTEISVVFG